MTTPPPPPPSGRGRGEERPSPRAGGASPSGRLRLPAPHRGGGSSGGGRRRVGAALARDVLRAGRRGAGQLRLEDQAGYAAGAPSCSSCRPVALPRLPKPGHAAPRPLPSAGEHEPADPAPQRQLQPTACGQHRRQWQEWTEAAAPPPPRAAPWPGAYQAARTPPPRYLRTPTSAHPPPPALVQAARRRRRCRRSRPLPLSTLPSSLSPQTAPRPEAAAPPAARSPLPRKYERHWLRARVYTCVGTQLARARPFFIYY